MMGTQKPKTGRGGMGAPTKTGPAAPGYQKKKSRNEFGASDEKIHKKPHATKEGSWASIKRARKRFEDKTYKIEDYGDKSLHTQWKAEHKARHKKMKNKAKGGRAGFQGGGRTRLLEELGRVEAEPSNRNRRAEISRVHGELNRGYSHGGRVGAAKRGFNKKILRKD